jgi:hypothetical protein
MNTRAWINHAALNSGSAIACIWYALLPPQWTGHSPETCRSLAETTPLRAFLNGLRSED